MQWRRLIASGLLLAVLLAPALGLALCNTAESTAMSGCSHCARMNHGVVHPHDSSPVAPCCQRKAPMPALAESSAQIVAPLQIALLPSHSSFAALPALPALRIERLVSPPTIVASLSLLCTLRI